MFAVTSHLVPNQEKSSLSRSAPVKQQPGEPGQAHSNAIISTAHFGPPTTPSQALAGSVFVACCVTTCHTTLG